MKKFLLSAVALLLVNVSFAQFEKKIESSNADIQNPKKQAVSKTWIARATLFQDIFDEPTKGLSSGLPLNQAGVILYGQKEKSTATENIGGENYTVVTYDDKKLYYNSENALAFWDVTKALANEPLKTAYEAYQEAIKYDPKSGVGNKKIQEGLIRLASQYQTSGTNNYQFQKYEEAYKDFKMSLDCSSSPIVNVTDSTIIYFSGIAANFAKKNHEAEQMFEKAVNIGYARGGDTYVMYANTLSENGKKEQALQVLEKAMVQFPDNSEVLLTMINLYIKSGDDPKKIIPLLKKAQTDQPENISLYLVEGSLYEQLKDMDNALASFQRALAKDPKSFPAQFSIGAAYFNKGATYLEEANKVDISDVAGYDKLVKLADEQFELALPSLIEAHKLDPKDKSVVQSLKDVYFRFRNKGDSYQENFKKFEEMLQTM